MTNFAITDVNGHQLADNLHEGDARDVAQTLADDRGEPVYLYTDPDQHGATLTPVWPRKRVR